MDEIRTFTFNQDDDSIRLDKYLSEMIPEMSRSQIQRLIRSGNVSVDGETITKNGYILEKTEHALRIAIPEPAAIDVVPEKFDLDILFEDENVLVVNKPAGMVMHPSAGHTSGTLVHAALGYDPFLAGIGGKMRPGIVHRLDRDTSGVVLIAKNDHSHRWLQKQFKERETEKCYIALVDKHPPTLAGKIEAPIYRDPNDRKKMAIAPDGKGKNAITIFHTQKKYDRYSLLDIQILTGRTHQIRVHLASLGSPISGDTLYGYTTPTLDLGRHFLHARSLAIRLPDEKEKTAFSVPLPDDLEKILKNLK